MMFLSAAWLLGCAGAQTAVSSPIPQSNPTVDQRASQTLSQMTLDEKIDILSGVDGFNERGVPRLGVPKLLFSDGPVGVRNFGPTTAYPAGVSLAATFNPALARQFGVAIGRDARARGVHAWLGPGVNLSRVPQNGRNFEYLGEDPYLASKTVVQIIQGVQSQGVVATVKHYAANNHENDRMVDSSEVDERTLRELYFRPFEAAVKEGGVGAVMCAYNKLNGTYCAENPWLLTTVLKNDWGFKGILMSDWGAVHSTLPTIKAGLDLEMPEGDFLNRNTIKPLLASGEVTMNDIDDKVFRILRLTYSMNFDQRDQLDTSIAKDDPANEQAALQVAREGTVLLKNRNDLLPLNAARIHHILVVGPNADPAITGGGGSSYTTPAESTSLLAAIQSVAGPNVKIDYRPLVSDFIDRALEFRGYTLPDGSGTPGLKMERFDNMDLSGAPVETRTSRRVRMAYHGDAAPTHFSVRWTGNVQFDRTGDYTAASRSDDGIRVFLDDNAIIDDWNDHGEKPDTAVVHVEKGKSYRLRIEYYQGTGDAVAMFGFLPVGDTWEKNFPVHEVETADAVIASVGFNPAMESEGQDRPFDLPGDQNALIEKVASLNPRTIVVNNSGAGVNMMPWVGKTGAVIQAWYPGGIGSQAIAEIIFGITNPSGKLPTTFPKTLKGTYYETAYPPVDHKVFYKEGLFIGYRWFDANHVDPLFPFGYGLSYTKFRVSAFKFQGDQSTGIARLLVTIKNTGSRDGFETIQAYVHDRHSVVVRPEKELKGFRKVFLRAGETKEFEVPIKVSDLAYFDVDHHKWVLENGQYDLLVGTSSRDLPLRGSLTIGSSSPK
jgi:beta-glucosidase